MLLIILLVKSTGSTVAEIAYQRRVQHIQVSHWSLSMELFWNLVCDNLRVPYLTSLRSKHTTVHSTVLLLMSWLPGWYSTEHRSYTAGQTLVPSVGSLYSHWTHLGKCIDVATSLQARSSILFDIIQQVPFLSSRHCCVVLTIIIRHFIAFAFACNYIWDTTSDILFHVRVFPESQLASPY